MAINFDYNKTIQQAKQLEELAGDMTGKAVKKLDEVAGNVEAAWSGRSGETYLKYIRTVKEDLAKKAKHLRDVAEMLRTAAKRLKEADAKAKAASAKI